MSVLSWLSPDFSRAPVSRAVMSVYTPVATVEGSRTRRSGSLGTPEIFFAKSIDNTRLVAAADPQRTKEMRVFFASVACLFILSMAYALQHFSAIEYGYKIEAQKKFREELIEANRSLRLEEASLRDPERIDVLARRMGLESPRAGQMQRLEVNGDPAVPVMAKVSGLAVVLSQ
ncbi:MAG: cell division protein FtsL [Acidobacteriales bacterium]|nr:cell division protein FtsL [Terriglobales bacterium]